MGREIKFRAWHKDLKVMLEEITIYPNMIGIDYDNFEEALPEKYELFEDEIYFNDLENNEHRKICSILLGDGWIWIENEDVEVMQFTGLLNSTGKEIYEDDICKVEEGYFGDFKESEFIGKVEFEDGCYFINDLKTNQYQSLDYAAIKNRNIEVLGNIYENPELLNVT